MAIDPGLEGRAQALRPLRGGNLSEGPTGEHPDIRKGSRGDPETSPGGGAPLPDSHFESPAQVCLGSPAGGVGGGASLLAIPLSRCAFTPRLPSENSRQGRRSIL